MWNCLVIKPKHSKGRCSSEMMVSQLLTNEQLETLSRQQKRQLERKHQKKIISLKKRISKTDLPVTFDNNTVTAFGGFGLLESFKQVIGFKDMLQQVKLVRHHNCQYTNTDLLDTIVDALSLGLLRFSHMEALQKDPGYQKIKDVLKVADESTLRYFLDRLSEQKGSEQLARLNQSILSLKAQCDSPREVWLDIDDSVITVFGQQKGSEIGYNPRYRGRASYKIKVAFISETGELVNVRLYGGKVASNGQFREFLKETLDILAAQKIIVKGIRIDKGFFDENNFVYLEEQNIEYIAKAKLSSTVRKIISYLDEQNQWQPISQHYAAGEITIPLPQWTKARRFAFIRESIKPKVDGKQIALDLETYDYEVMVTSCEDLTPEAVWHEYNKRCNVENKIDEIKAGLGFEQMSQQEMERNSIFMWLKALSYNLLNWFRLTLLDNRSSHFEVITVRRKILNVPGNLVGQNRYRHIKLAPDARLQNLVSFAKQKLKDFLYLRAWVAVNST